MQLSTLGSRSRQTTHSLFVAFSARDLPFSGRWAWVAIPTDDTAMFDAIAFEGVLGTLIASWHMSRPLGLRSQQTTQRRLARLLFKAFWAHYLFLGARRNRLS